MNTATSQLSGLLSETSVIQLHCSSPLTSSLGKPLADSSGITTVNLNSNSQLNSSSGSNSDVDLQKLTTFNNRALSLEHIAGLRDGYLCKDYVQPFLTNSAPLRSTSMRKPDDHILDSLAPVGVNVRPQAEMSEVNAKPQFRLRTLQDRSLRATTRLVLLDGLIDRQDMLTLFNDVEDGGSISRSELKDLKKIVGSATKLNMPDDVQDLADKVVNGAFANRNYQGAALGNLSPGSSASHLAHLVDKWFFGGDRPVAQSYWDGSMYTYQLVKKPLFENGISYTDIKQGSSGDCYFLVALASIALHDNDIISSMFIDNGDNTYTVRFYDYSGDADYVTVDSYLPVDQWGRPVFVDYTTELWVALAEKAYAQLNESGWIGHSKQNQQNTDLRPEDDDTNSYLGIYSGYPHDATEQITGQAMSYGWIDNTSFEAIATAFSAGHPVSLSSKSSVDAYIVPTHAYALVGYNATAQTVTLYNPWGVDGGSQQQDAKPNDGELELSWQEVYKNFEVWSTNASDIVA